MFNDTKTKTVLSWWFYDGNDDAERSVSGRLFHVRDKLFLLIITFV